MQKTDKALGICLIERRVNLIKHEERGSPHINERKQERDGDERPLPSGKHAEVFVFLSRNFCTNLNPFGKFLSILLVELSRVGALFGHVQKRTLKRNKME